MAYPQVVMLDSGVPYNPAPLPAAALQSAPAADAAPANSSLQQILQLIQAGSGGQPAQQPAAAPVAAAAPATVQGLSADQLHILGQLAAVLAGSAQLSGPSAGQR